MDPVARKIDQGAESRLSDTFDRVTLYRDFGLGGNRFDFFPHVKRRADTPLSPKGMNETQWTIRSISPVGEKILPYGFVPFGEPAHAA